MATVGIVTGAGRGMGWACAQRLVASVDTLFVVDVDTSSLAAASDALSDADTEVVPITLDVTDIDGVSELVARVGATGTLRAVAHAAGISPTMADWRRIFAVDLVGTARLTQALRPLVTRGTAMVCFASMAAQLGSRDDHPAADAALDAPLDPDLFDHLHHALGPSIEDTGTAYTWAKRGVQRLVRREAVEWGPAGGRLCSVSPGIIDTPQGRQEADAHPYMATLVAQTPLGRSGDAAEVAALVAFLLSDEAGFISGTDVLVDGGVCAAIASTPSTFG